MRMLHWRHCSRFDFSVDKGLRHDGLMKRAKSSVSDMRVGGGAPGTKEASPSEELALFAERYMHFTNVCTVYRDM